LNKKALSNSIFVAPSKFSGTHIIDHSLCSSRGARTRFTTAADTMKPPATLGTAVLLLWWSASVTVVGAERVRGGGAAATSFSSSDATAHRRRQIRKLKNRGEPVRYARLLLDEGDPADDEANEEQEGRRRLPPSKVSKACSSKSLKGSKEGGKAGSGGGGKAEGGKASKSGTDARPSCDTERSFCSCPSCTQEVLDRMAGEYTCGARMEYLLAHNSGAFSKTRQACGRVAGLEFPKGAWRGVALEESRSFVACD
jgi:hypothetical protein